MKFKRVKCISALMAEFVFGKFQEVYSHVEYISYDGEELTVMYIP